MAIEYLTVEHIHTKELTRIFRKIYTCDDMWFQGTPCWLWCGNRTSDCGYPHITFRSQILKVHRLMFAWLVHPIPKGRKIGELDHLCRVVACCNPLHLEFVTAQINVLRSNAPPALNARKSHCKHGHPLSGDNLFYDQGKRQCRLCKNAQGRKSRAANPDKYREIDKRWRTRNKEKLQAWYEANREEIRRYQRERYHARRKQVVQ